MAKEEELKVYLSNLFEDWSGEVCISIVPLELSGSYRRYFRISGSVRVVIGVFNEDVKENIAFLEFTDSFLRSDLPVPVVYCVDSSKRYYLLEDLGDTSLFSLLSKTDYRDSFPDSLFNIYKSVIDNLINFQFNGGKDLDYSFSYPRFAFDKQSIMWDLNYFKYYFLKLRRVSFDEQLLEDAFNIFAELLLGADCNYCLYRDFQSRNIMLKGSSPYFIDYQGARKGAIHYDIGSLLFDSRADLPFSVRESLLDYYVNSVSSLVSGAGVDFDYYYYLYVLVRIMQALGAYGFRGIYEGKAHFLDSIPYAIRDISFILDNKLSSMRGLDKQIGELILSLERIVSSDAIGEVFLQ